MHLDLPPALLPDDYLLMTIDLRDLAIETVVRPAGRSGRVWRRLATGPAERRAAVPSLIVPESPNLQFNLAHPDAARARIVAQRRFVFDRLLWLPLWWLLQGPVTASPEAARRFIPHDCSSCLVPRFRLLWPLPKHPRGHIVDLPLPFQWAL